MQVSGPYSVTLMTENDNKFFLISDVHIKGEGCENKNAKTIYDFLNDLFQSGGGFLYLLEYSYGLIPRDNQGFMVELFSKTTSCFIEKGQDEPLSLPRNENRCINGVKYIAMDIRQSSDGTIFSCWQSCPHYDKLIENIDKLDKNEILEWFNRINTDNTITNNCHTVFKNTFDEFKKNYPRHFELAWKSMFAYIQTMLDEAFNKISGDEFKQYIQRVLGVICVDLYAIAMMNIHNENKNVVIYAGDHHIKNYIRYIEYTGGTIYTKVDKEDINDRCIDISNDMANFFNNDKEIPKNDIYFKNSLPLIKMAYYETSPEDDVNKLLSYGHPMVIKFYSPTCHHCKTIAPFFSSYAKLNGAKIGDPISKNKPIFIMVDSTKCGKLCSTLGAGIRGFPTIRAFKTGQNKHTSEKIGSVASQEVFYENMNSMLKSL